jgi:hypothetical protein
MPGKADPDRAAVLQDWAETFGSPPPPYLSVAFMRKALAHEAQCRKHGGLPAATRRALKRIADGQAVTESTKQIAGPARISCGNGMAGPTRSRCWRRDTGWTAARGPRSRRSQSTSQARRGPARASSDCRIAQGAHEEDPLRHLYPQEFRGRAGAGVQLAPCPAGGLRRLHRQPEARGLGDADGPIRRWRPVRRQSGTPGAAAPPRRCPERPGRPDRGLQDRPAHPVARGLRQDRRRARCGRRVLRVGDAVLQHGHQHGPPDAEHASVLRAVRAGGHRGAHPGQDRGVQAQGALDGRQGAAGIRSRWADAEGQRDRGTDHPQAL